MDKSKIKVLLVEDDEFIRDIFHEILVAEGYAISTAENGKEAYEKLKKDKWDLVLLDVMMPMLTGIEVIQKLNKEKVNTWKKLIFLTNVDDPRDIAALVALGDGYFLKSDLTPPGLITKVKEVLGLS